MADKIYSYENFDLSSLSSESLEFIVWGICIGVLIGAFVSILYRSCAFSLIRRLIAREAFDESRALTVNELNPRGKRYLKRALSASDKPLRRYVACANEEETQTRPARGFRKFWYKRILGADVPARLPMDRARFYLPEENRIGAEVRFTEVRNPVGSFILTAVLLVAAAFFVIYAAPELLQMLDNFITTIKPTDSGIL